MIIACVIENQFKDLKSERIEFNFPINTQYSAVITSKIEDYEGQGEPPEPPYYRISVKTGEGQSIEVYLKAEDVVTCFKPVESHSVTRLKVIQADDKKELEKITNKFLIENHTNIKISETYVSGGNLYLFYTCNIGEWDSVKGEGLIDPNDEKVDDSQSSDNLVGAIDPSLNKGPTSGGSYDSNGAL